jgi:hypothetical protein
MVLESAPAWLCIARAGTAPSDKPIRIAARADVKRVRNRIVFCMELSVGGAAARDAIRNFRLGAPSATGCEVDHRTKLSAALGMARLAVHGGGFRPKLN